MESTHKGEGRPGQRPIDQHATRARIDALIADCGGDPRSRDGSLIRSKLTTSLKLITDHRNTGELKLLSRSLAELRHALRIFGEHPDSPKVSIFGSARTPADHPDYATAVEFAALMSQRGWLSITGAGDGIMKAGHEGSGRDSSFGLAIRLPFETTANSIIAGDAKLITFRYFFTRKTVFLSQSQAVVALPGGFGTLDELMEVLTLIQTGKSAMIPVVLLAGPDSNYWQHWEAYVRGELLTGGFVSEADTNLYHLAADPVEAADHISRFYANYHSSRYVGDDYVIRIRTALPPQRLDQLGEDFADLVASGGIVQRGAYDTEAEYRDLPRIAFTHTRRDHGRVRALVDRINDYAIEDGLVG